MAYSYEITCHWLAVLHKPIRIQIHWEQGSGHFCVRVSLKTEQFCSRRTNSYNSWLCCRCLLNLHFFLTNLDIKKRLSKSAQRTTSRDVWCSESTSNCFTFCFLLANATANGFLPRVDVANVVIYQTLYWVHWFGLS